MKGMRHQIIKIKTINSNLVLFKPLPPVVSGTAWLLRLLARSL